MLREEYLRRLVDESYIDIYLSGNEGARIYWPWRMQPVHEATQRYRNCCEKYIVDSSFKDESITNVDVFDKAHSLNAEYAVLADVYQDKDATVDRIIEGLDTYDDHEYDGGLVAPLQAPHDACYSDIAGRDIDMVAIGGYKDASPHEQIKAARSLRNVAGDSIHIHGLGWGLRRDGDKPNELVSALHENPNLIDSIDYSTPVQDTTTPEHDIDTGEETSSVQAAQVGERLVRDLRRVTEFAEVETDSTQSGMGKFGSHTV